MNRLSVKFHQTLYQWKIQIFVVTMTEKRCNNKYLLLQWVENVVTTNICPNFYSIKPMFKIFCCRFCFSLGPIWRYNPQYNPQHECSKTRGEGGVKGCLNNVKKIDDLAREGVPNPNRPCWTGWQVNFLWFLTRKANLPKILNIFHFCQTHPPLQN